MCHKAKYVKAGSVVSPKGIPVRTADWPVLIDSVKKLIIIRTSTL